MKIVAKYSFNKGREAVEKNYPDEIREIYQIIEGVEAEHYLNKESREKTKEGQILYSPIGLNSEFSRRFSELGWQKQRIRCEYTNLDDEVEGLLFTAKTLISVLSESEYSIAKIKEIIQTHTNQIDKEVFSPISANKLYENLKKLDYFESSNTSIRQPKWKLNTKISADDLIQLMTPDFVGFREMDFTKNKLGVEVQFGKYAFMVYNVCAKMTIFSKQGFIKSGVEIVPVKKLQKNMSTGVSFFEQFVWDLETRGESNIDIPVLIIGIDA